MKHPSVNSLVHTLQKMLRILVDVVQNTYFLKIVSGLKVDQFTCVCPASQLFSAPVLYESPFIQCKSPIYSCHEFACFKYFRHYRELTE